MKDFVIYSYQFSPLIDDRQLNLFEDVHQLRKELMEHKNQLFDGIIDGIEFKYRNKAYQKVIALHKDDIIIMRLANRRSVKIEKAFHILEEDDEPSSLIIIDNRDGIQRIAIERNPHSFGDTDTIKNILVLNFRRGLKDKQLQFSIGKEFLPKEFWDICNRYKGKVTKVVFSYQYPNLGRAHEEMKKMLKDSSTTANSEMTQITYENKNGLIIDKDNEVVSGCVTDSSNGGEPISLRIKGISKNVKTGKTEKSVKIDEIQIENGDIDALKTILKDC